VDAQFLRAADSVGTATRGDDAGKRVNGRKRHIVVDTIGLLLAVWVTAASVQTGTVAAGSSRPCTRCYRT